MISRGPAITKDEGSVKGGLVKGFGGKLKGGNPEKGERVLKGIGGIKEEKTV